MNQIFGIYNHRKFVTKVAYKVKLQPYDRANPPAEAAIRKTTRIMNGSAIDVLVDYGIDLPDAPPISNHVPVNPNAYRLANLDDYDSTADYSSEATPMRLNQLNQKPTLAKVVYGVSPSDAVKKESAIRELELALKDHRAKFDPFLPEPAKQALLAREKVLENSLSLLRTGKLPKYDKGPGRHIAENAELALRLPGNPTMKELDSAAFLAAESFNSLFNDLRNCEESVEFLHKTLAKDPLDDTWLYTVADEFQRKSDNLQSIHTRWEAVKAAILTRRTCLLRLQRSRSLNSTGKAIINQALAALDIEAAFTTDVEVKFSLLSSAYNAVRTALIPLKYTKEESDGTCPICIDTFEMRGRLTVRHCGHFTHIMCHTEWMRSDQFCPHCKSLDLTNIVDLATVDCLKPAADAKME